MRPPLSDDRPILRLAEATWTRESPDGRWRLLDEATRLGVRLVIAGPDGADWTPDPGLADW